MQRKSGDGILLIYPPETKAANRRQGPRAWPGRCEDTGSPAGSGTPISMAAGPAACGSQGCRGRRRPAAGPRDGAGTTADRCTQRGGQLRDADDPSLPSLACEQRGGRCTW
jgi:hypothetical protein